MKLRRFWIEFFPQADMPPGTKWGCGVTATSLQQALVVLQSHAFRGNDLPKVKRVIEDVDISQLDQNHVIPNMGIAVKPGIWFPQGY